ncbi:kinase-like protein [Rhizophagus irregularis]|uniref:Kinase-like protein n=1 Tax=Rhizophagus irregularis TaxID=588596 RepID=A0A2N1NK28_9GLOM|nr:kinase-like protein [Rhizophagus irregularis]
MFLFFIQYHITSEPDNGKVESDKKSKKYKISFKKSSKENAKVAFKTATEIAQKFIPYLDTAIGLANSIIECYDLAKYNKEICRVMADRVELAVTSIKLLKRSINNGAQFQEKSYYEAFLHFNEILIQIESFVKEVSSMNKFIEFFNAAYVKSQFEVIRDDFDHAYKALHLAISIDQVIDREKEDSTIKTTLQELKEYYQNIHKGMSDNYNLTTVLAAKVENLENNSDKNLLFEPPRIDPRDITPHDLTDYHGNVKLMKYKTLDVACKKINTSIDEDSPDSKRVRGTLAIWNQLHECPHIIRFLGISKLDIGNCMIFEWAELGNLKDVYEGKKKITLTWQAKLYIARDVSRGLGFLHVIGILHHNIKAENILVTDNGYKCKITNFDLSRGIEDESHELTDIIDVIRWMAPEKIESFRSKKYVPYTYKCEMYSFGMFLWELSFNRIPYEYLKPNEISKHVMEEKRETLEFEDGPSDIIEGFKNIIELAWQQDPKRRPEDPVVSKILETLAKTHSFEGHPYEKSINESVTSLAISQTSQSETDTDEFSDLILGDEDDDFELLPLQKGLDLHHNKSRELKTAEDYKLSWIIFKAHAEFGNKLAIYWKGYYLWEGYFVEKDRKEAVRLFKIAADAGIAEAQLRYAFAFIKNPDLPYDKDIFLEYLTKSAENGNVVAIYNLGDVYYKGKRQVPENKEKGIEYLKIAALKNYKSATEALKKYNVSL